MSSSSDEESDLSESEINEYKEKPYQELRAGKFKVRGPNGTLRCPFCAGKKKQDYKYKDLLQHASGVGKGSANRSAKQKANHLALAMYLQTDLANEAEPLPPSVVSATPAPKPEQNDLYCWPWSGIVVNILNGQNSGNDMGNSGYWLKKFSKYNPLEVEIFWDDNEKAAQAVVTFDKDWTGFKDAMEFEKSFETNQHSRKEWVLQRSAPVSDIYGWFAREDDYKSEGPVGKYLRERRELKTISGRVQEEIQDRNKIVANLALEIDLKNENLDELQVQYNQKTWSLSRMLEEKDMLHRAFYEESKRMQRLARENVRRVLQEQEMLNLELEKKKKKIDAWTKELSRREALTERDRQKLDEEKKKNDVSINALELASEEQRRADENVLRLVEAHKREKEEALKKILELERENDAKQKLEMDIQELKGKIEVMNHLGGDDAAVQKKLNEMKEELKSKEEEMEYMQDLNQDLLNKERLSNDELQEARKVLIQALREQWTSPRALIGIKRMGEIDEKAIKSACEKKFPEEDRDIEAAKFCSMWQEKLKNPDWHPFKMVKVAEDNYKKVLDENDEELQNLKKEWGDEGYNAVTEALQDLEEYNPSGRYVIPELWNFSQKRKATLKEVISHLNKQLKTNKRKRQ